MKLVKKIISICIAKIWIKKHIKNNKDVQYFYCPSGIGDTLYVLAYMKQYTERYNKKVTFIIKKSHIPIVNMYSNYIENTIIPSQRIYKILDYYFRLKMQKERRTIYAHPLKLMYDPCLILGTKNICLLDLYKILLKLPNDAEYETPCVKNIDKEGILKQNNITKRKKILLCPYCVSIPMINCDIWEKIAEKYISEGYDVFTNVKDETEKPIKGTIPLALNIEELYAIVEDFSEVFAIRSGICDLIAFSNVDFTVLYPSTDKEEKSKFYEQYNFKNIGIRNNIKEIIVSDNTDILNKINNKEETNENTNNRS